jgi:N-dimethylarginine dimethylaminohydrolase
MAVEREATRPAYGAPDVLKQGKTSPHGGPGWAARGDSLISELGTIWAACGVNSEVGRLRSVLMHRPGVEIDDVPDVAAALWHERLEPERAREQHDRLVETYRAHGVAVRYLEQAPPDKPNLYFCRDLFAMTPTGAILARPASRARAGEERHAALALATLGVPIALSVHGEGTFEGADVVMINQDLVFIGEGIRTNASGAEQVRRLLVDVGFGEVEVVHLPYGCGHLDGVLSLVDRDLAILYPTQTPYRVWEALARHGIRTIDIPDPAEAQYGMAINLVPLDAGVVVMPAGNPVTRRTLERHGVTCVEAEVDELMKGGGSVHCMTGVVQREHV